MATKPTCLSALMGLVIMAGLCFLVCGGCLYGGFAVVKQANEQNAAIEAAKSPEQKAQEKAKKEQDDLEGTLRYMGEQLVMKQLEYPLNSKLYRHAKVTKKGPNKYAVTGLVDASNAFGVIKRMKYGFMFERASEKHDWEATGFAMVPE